MASAADILAKIETVIAAAESGAEAIVAYVTNLIAIWKASDQATIDELHAQALAAANAELPAGAAPLT